MKKLLVTLTGAALLLAACGGLEDDIKGHTYEITLTNNGEPAKVGEVEFDGKKASGINGDETERYIVKDNEIVFDEGQNEKVTFYNLKKDSEGNYEGKAKSSENGKEIMKDIKVEMNKVK